MNQLREWLISLMKSAFVGFDTMIEESVDVLEEGLTQWSAVDGTIAGALRPFCYTIIGICLLIELGQVAAKVDIVKWEHGIKLCVKMVFAKVCIDLAPSFLEACYSQAQSWISSVGENPTTIGTNTADSLATLIREVNGLWNILGLFLSTFIVLLAVKICGLMVQVIAYGRMFELYVYLAVSPVPCAFFPLGDGDGGGISRITSKFFKSFAAVCLQGVMMVIAIKVFGLIMSGVVEGLVDAAVNSGEANDAVTDLIYAMLLGSVSLVMAVTKCGSWAKGILDAM